MKIVQKCCSNSGFLGYLKTQTILCSNKLNNFLEDIKNHYYVEEINKKYGDSRIWPGEGRNSVDICYVYFKSEPPKPRQQFKMKFLKLQFTHQWILASHSVLMSIARREDTYMCSRSKWKKSHNGKQIKNYRFFRSVLFFHFTFL